MSNDWRDELRGGLESLLDEAVLSGAKQADVFNAAIEEIKRLRRSSSSTVQAKSAWKVGLVGMSCW